MLTEDMSFDFIVGDQQYSIMPYYRDDLFLDSLSYPEMNLVEIKFRLSKRFNSELDIDSELNLFISFKFKALSRIVVLHRKRFEEDHGRDFRGTGLMEMFYGIRTCDIISEKIIGKITAGSFVCIGEYDHLIIVDCERWEYSIKSF